MIVNAEISELLKKCYGTDKVTIEVKQRGTGKWERLFDNGNRLFFLEGHDPFEGLRKKADLKAMKKILHPPV